MNAYDNQIVLNGKAKINAFHAFLRAKRGSLTNDQCIKKLIKIYRVDKYDAEKLFRNLKRYFNEEDGTKSSKTVREPTWLRLCKLLEISRQDWEEYWRDSQTKNESPTEPDADSSSEGFLSGIKQHIIDELNSVELLKKQVKLELDACLKNILNSPLTVNDETDTLVETWVEILRNSKDKCPAINNVLWNSTANCLDEKKKANCFNKASGKHKAIKDALLQILGLLSLAAIDDTAFLEFIKQSEDQSLLHFEIPVETQAGVELILSRHNNRQPNLVSDGVSLKFEHLVEGTEHIINLGWSANEIAQNLELLVWNSVPNLGKKTEGNFLSDAELKELDTELGTLSEYDAPYKMQFTLVIPQSQIYAALGESTVFLKEVYQKLHLDLPNLTLVQFKMQGNRLFFYIPERQLMSAIKNYLIFIDKLCPP